MGRNQHKSKKARSMTMPANMMMMNPMAAMNPLLLQQLASAMMAPPPHQQVESDSSSDDHDDRRASGSVAVAKASSQAAALPAPLQDGPSQLPHQAADVTAQNAQAYALQALRDRRAYLFSSVGADKKIHRGAAMIRNLPKDTGLGVITANDDDNDNNNNNNNNNKDDDDDNNNIIQLNLDQFPKFNNYDRFNLYSLRVH